MTPEVAAVLESLQQEDAAMLHPLDIPPTWTQRQGNDYQSRRLLVPRLISLIRVATDSLAEVEPQLARLTQEHTDLEAIRAELCTELLACPPRPRSRTDIDHQQALKISIRGVDGTFDLQNNMIPPRLPLFTKLLARGYVAPPAAPWNPMAALFGTLPTIERRLKDLEKRRAQAQEQLDSAIAAATPTPATV
jgi:hypothetical protein